MDTIFAVSSGRPPAAIAILRVSGPEAIAAATTMAGSLPPPRVGAVRLLRDAGGAALDRALVLVFPGPASATGEDVVELHCHGGRAVVAAVERALAGLPGLRAAEPGEFTRRALTNGRIDLAQAEGLADLLNAETERQRIAAIGAAEGLIGRSVRGWLAEIALFAARVEATLDFADEDDVAAQGDTIDAVVREMHALGAVIGRLIAAPPVDRLRDGVRVVLAGPPNSGKSTLLNLLAQRDAAIVTPIAGTTRDRIDVSVQRDGVPYVLTDTAGLTETDDVVERIGVARAGEAMASADVLLWLGDAAPPRDALWLYPRADEAGRRAVPDTRIAVARTDEASIARVWDAIANAAVKLLPQEDQIAFNSRQRDACAAAVAELREDSVDPLIVAEHLRAAASSLGTILGIDTTEAMLDALFGQFCIGK